MKKVILTFSLFLSALTFMHGQEKLTNQSVMEMKAFGLSDQLITMKINSLDFDFDISNEAIAQLQKQGISEEVIALMVQKQTQYQALIGNTFFLYSIEVVADKIVVNQSIEVQKGDTLQVYLPYNRNKDFISLEEKQGIFSLKNIGKMADVLGSGALAVGLGTSNVGTTMGALEVFSKTQSVAYGVDALEKISELPISNKAKKIAGKDFIISIIENDGAGNIIVEGTIEKKKYTTTLNQALILGELKIKK